MRGGHLSTPIVTTLGEHRVSRRNLITGTARVAAAGSLAYALGGRFATAALAQEATPAAGDYQELTVTITDTEMIASVDQLSPGYVLFTVQNRGSMPATAALITMPDLTAESLAEMAATPVAEDEFPSFLFTATIAGGPQDADPGKNSQAFLHLTPGNWAVVAEYSQPPILITVGDGAEVGSEPASSVTVQEPDFLFVGLDAGIPAGKQVWKVVNTGSQPHMLVVAQIPDGTTRELLMESIMQPPDATPAPGLLTESDVRDVGGVLMQSPGQTVWPVLDLAKGTYMAACWVPDPNNGGMPHAMEGMLTVFDVGA